VRCTAGGTGYPGGVEKTGVELLVWDGGRWTELDSAGAGADSPVELSWTTTDEAVFSRLPVTDSRYLGFAVTPQHHNGTDWAHISSQYLELTITYRKQ